MDNEDLDKKTKLPEDEDEFDKKTKKMRKILEKICDEEFKEYYNSIRTDVANVGNLIIEKESSNFKEAESSINKRFDDVAVSLEEELKNSSEILNSANKIQEFMSRQSNNLNELMDFVRERNSKLEDENRKMAQKIGEKEAGEKNLNQQLNEAKEQLDKNQIQLESIKNQYSQEQAKYISLQQKAADYERKLSEKEIEINNLNATIKEKGNSIEEIKKEIGNLDANNADLKQKYDDLSGKYQNLNIDENLVAAYQNFDSLSEKTKNSLVSIFPHGTFLGFVSSGLRLNNIASLWETARRNIFNDNLEDIEKLNEIFTILLNVYNEGSLNKQFELVIPEIGSKYDSYSCSIKELKSSGTVSKIYLAGYKNIKDGDIHKAVISVTD